MSETNLDSTNRLRGICKHMFSINPEILRPPWTEIAVTREGAYLSRYADTLISAHEGRRISGLTLNICLHIPLR